MREERLEQVETELAARSLIAVLTVRSAAEAVSTARALKAGGVTVIELTLRTPAALGALRAVKEAVPEMLLGAGTVLEEAQVDAAAEAGADFAVSPGLNPEIVETAQGCGLPFFPGVMTPSEIQQALELDCRILKYFPAEAAGGLTYLRQAAAPFRHLKPRFIPLGGIDEGNLAEYLCDPLVLAVGGSRFAPAELMSRGDWDGIVQQTRKMVAFK